MFAAAITFLFLKIKQNKNLGGPAKPPPPINAAIMKIQSYAFGNNQIIPSKYTCDGENINPPLEFVDVPKNISTLVLIVDDPDAPMGTWVHWTVWNIAPDINLVAENSVPQSSVQGKTSSGQNVYGGPCPPSGTHRYFFKLFALDSKLTVPSYSTAADLEKAMQGHILDEAELVGLYKRP